MTKELIKRMDAAINRIGGSLAVLALPDEIREIVTSCPDYETRVKMLEMIADEMNR